MQMRKQDDTLLQCHYTKSAHELHLLRTESPRARWPLLSFPKSIFTPKFYTGEIFLRQNFLSAIFFCFKNFHRRFFSTPKFFVGDFFLRQKFLSAIFFCFKNFPSAIFFYAKNFDRRDFSAPKFFVGDFFLLQNFLSARFFRTKKPHPIGCGYFQVMRRWHTTSPARR